MNKIKEDECYEYYEALFEGYKVSFKVEKNIKESVINLLMIGDINDVDNFLLECIRSFKLDIAMLESFFKTDEGLDFITKWKKEHPGESFFYDETMKTLKENIRSTLVTLIESQKEGLKQINKNLSKEIFKGKNFLQ